MPFRNVQHLSDLTIGGKYCYSFIADAEKHTSYSSKLRKLKLMAPLEVMDLSELTFNYPDNFPILDNLRELELELRSEAGTSLHFFAYFIKASPLLSSFTARITYSMILYKEFLAYHRQSQYTADGFVHKHLKVVKLIGFTGCTSDFELVSHLIEIGASLEEMILQRKYGDVHYQISQMPLIRNQIEHLEEKVPPGVKLVM